MILEHAWLKVTEGREGEFEAAMAAALPIIESAPGCHGAEVRRCEEESGRYALIVKWESVTAHMDGFRESALFEEWRAATHPFYSEKPVVLHYSAPLPR